MLDDLERITERLDPRSTVVVLGAGAAISSGALTAVDLCRELENSLAGGERISDELAEVASILVRRTSRTEVVDAIRQRLRSLQPDGALLGLARRDLAAIYTTNYDTLIEDAFARIGRDIGVVRSNYDFEHAHRVGTVPLFKIHGCVTQDISSGHKSRMIVTYDDYDETASYRELLYGRLQQDLASFDAVILGYSLQDHDVQSLLREAVRLQRQSGAPGRIHLILYSAEEERAAVWRDRGIYRVAEGDINRFVHALSPSEETTGKSSTSPRDGSELSPSLEACTVVVDEHHPPAKAERLFLGAPATYGDIRAGHTFERDIEGQVERDACWLTVILGVAGTGKSTLARRLLLNWTERESLIAYEHRRDFPLQAREWLQQEEVLRSADRKAVLLIDDCTVYQRDVNRLVRKLPKDGALRLVLTSESSTWKVRQKAPELFQGSQILTLSQLRERSLRALLGVVRGSDSLCRLIAPAFLRRTEAEQLRDLSRRCTADMFVCLKALFSTDSLDVIVLDEFARLDELYQTLYLTTCALEAAGAVPHRQMVLRVTGIEAAQVAGSLDVLEGLVEENEVSPTKGIFTWRSRHEVVAELIARYKYSDAEDLFSLLKTVISTANPTYGEEIRTLREMCNARRGIAAIPSAAQRLARISQGGLERRLPLVT